MDVPRSTKTRRNRRIRYGLYALAGLLLVVLTTVGLSRLKPAAPSVERSTLYTDKVRRGQMLRQVRGNGTLIPEEIRQIASPVQGRVERIHSLPGVEVSAGTVLMELSNPTLEQAAVNAEYQVKAAEADLRNLRVKLESDRMSQEATTANIQAEYKQAKIQLDSDEALGKEGLVPPLTLKLSRVRVDELANRVEIEQKRLAINTEAVNSQIISQQARVEQLRALAQLNREQVASLRVAAGTGGVLQQVSVVVGQEVSPGTNLARVADPRSLKAALQIPETQAKDVVVNQPALIDTRNGGTITGRVQRIDPAVQNGTVTVDVQLTGEMPPGVRPDLSVDGTIELERLDNVLFLNRPTFVTAQATVGLFKLEEGGTSAVRVNVKIGRMSVNTVEILEGLREGDEVILSDTSAYDNFSNLRLR
ncbi:MAG TPA: HlyD family efflux transporter periplasmic adaptor subunit [Pyrinomonadaceae bacterium]|jgi:HlyD family secretion protein|nr:HlyD family efflux transporter periplasmic adaptor subunit [Pyrinomonadaceae bacterium]